LVAEFDPPLSVGANATIVVEVEQADRSVVVGWPQPPADNGDIGISSNPAGESAPSYIRSDGCGLGNFTEYAAIGFGDIMIVQELHLVND
jgi:hypothetical protein